MGYLSKRKFEEREHYVVTGLVFFIPILTFINKKWLPYANRKLRQIAI